MLCVMKGARSNGAQAHGCAEQQHAQGQQAAEHEKGPHLQQLLCHIVAVLILEQREEGVTLISLKAVQEAVHYVNPLFWGAVAQATLHKAGASIACQGCYSGWCKRKQPSESSHIYAVADTHPNNPPAAYCTADGVPQAESLSSQDQQGQTSTTLEPNLLQDMGIM